MKSAPKYIKLSSTVIGSESGEIIILKKRQIWNRELEIYKQGPTPYEAKQTADRNRIEALFPPKKYTCSRTDSNLVMLAT